MSTWRRWIAGGLLLAALATGGVAMLHFGVYGWTLFVLGPVLLGAVAALIFCPRTSLSAMGIGAAAVAVATPLLLAAGLEGAICIVMALPLTAALGALGGVLVYCAGSSRLAAPGATMLVLLTPASLTWDIKAPPKIFEVRSSVMIAAPPEQVWKHVVTFSELPDPIEWFFRAGVAYPVRARIDGSGPGAIRYCEFSTGPFVEPIEVWDEPRLLRFRVSQNPPPMREWSPYGDIVTKHLHGYLVSEGGQFRLTRSADGNTLLEGATWYQHGLWPAEYWRWWSDAIIHRIHLRVLNHIREVTEAEAFAAR